MPLPFSLSSRPSLPSLSWATGTSNNTKAAEEPVIQSAPPRTSFSSITSRRLSSSRNIKRTSITVSRPTTPANPSPLSSAFGLPAVDDEDPFGVLALQNAGLLIKEAGTQHRPGSEAFQYRPSPTSPIWRTSMASAMSRTSRPSFEGRSSILTGRRSMAHSRQGSAGTIGTTGTNDVSSQTFDLDALEHERASIRGMSPVREAEQSTMLSPELKPKKSIEQLRNSVRPKPEPLLLGGEADIKRRDESISPRMRLEPVNEDVQEDYSKDLPPQDEQINAISPTADSDLDALAKELRAMAEEHEAESRHSQESSKASRVESDGDAETVAVIEEEGEDAKTPQRLSIDTSNVSIKVDTSVDANEPKRGPYYVFSPTIYPEVVEHQIEQTRQVQQEELTTGHEGEDDDEKDATEEEEEEVADEEDEEDEEEYDFDDEEPVIIEEVVTAAMPINVRPRNLDAISLQARAQIVSVHLPPPPKIPSRNPRRRQIEPVKTEIPDSAEDSEPPRSRSPSSQGGDSSSSYTFDHDQDSFDDGQDIMTQTSQGSEAGSTEVTPTRLKTFESISEKIERSLSSNSNRRSLDRTPEVQSAIPDVSIEHHDEDDVATPAAAVHEIKMLQHVEAIERLNPTGHLAPDVPERRRPFSFEVGANERDFNNSSIDATILDAKTAKHGESQSDVEIKETAGQPIIIPKLKEDDTSIYEEDFS